MCGIAGVVGPWAEGAQDVRTMCSAMVHRGPDDEGYFDQQDAHLGMRRLAIIDVAHGAQPIFNESGSVVTVLNGEIYNYRQLAGRLRMAGHWLITESDTETIVHLYEDHGAGLVDHLRGMFALAVWDRASGTLILARDRAGKKPLYYYEDSGRLWFASELKCLLALASTPREIDPVAHHLYLTYKYVPNPLSIFRGIRKLPPAHRLIWRDGKTRVERYWTLQFASEDQPSAEPVAVLAEQLREHLLEATSARMISERPLGAFLSGGLDSSAIVAAMARSSAQTIKTFAIGFSDEAFNELPHARRVAELYGTDHQELIVEPDVADLLPRLARAFDEPFGDSSAVPSFYLAQMARRHVVVALNGDGGDESLGGYTTYRHFLRLPPRWTLPRPGVRGMRRVSTFLQKHPTRSARINQAGIGLDRLAAAKPSRRYARLTSTFSPELLESLYLPDVRESLRGVDSAEQHAAIWTANQHTDPVNRLLAMDISTYLPGDLLPKVDITTMAVSLEARSPFLDQRFMEWAALIPGSLKVRGNTTKYLLKEALAPWLPQDLIHRRKMGFAVPLATWLAGPLQPLVQDLLLADGSYVSTVFRPGALSSLVDGVSARRETAGQVWSLLMLELWHRGLHAP